jgi:hypothetical protein
VLLCKFKVFDLVIARIRSIHVYLDTDVTLSLHCCFTALHTQALPNDDDVVSLLKSLSNAGLNVASDISTDTAPQEYNGHAYTANESITDYSANADDTSASHGTQASNGVHDANDIDDVDDTTGYAYNQVSILRSTQ